MNRILPAHPYDTYAVSYTHLDVYKRQGYTFVFNSYRLPADQWTTIRIEGDYKGTSLYINGALQERLEGRIRTLCEACQCRKTSRLKACCCER